MLRQEAAPDWNRTHRDRHADHCRGIRGCFPVGFWNWLGSAQALTYAHALAVSDNLLQQVCSSWRRQLLPAVASECMSAPKNLQPARRLQFSVSKLLGVMFLVSIGSLAYLHASPISAARAYCVTKGRQEKELFLTRIQSSGLPIRRSATVEFFVAKNGTHVRVHLRQALAILPWHVVSVEEFP